MIKKQLFVRARAGGIAAKLFLGIVLLFSSSALFAQVKIGTAPTTIDPNNNLEVQSSTTGRKLSVHKTTGKLTYADGTEGAGKVLTSNATGVASWQAATVGCASFEASRATQIIPIDDAVGGSGTTLIVNTESYDPANAFNTSTGEYTIPTTGMYAFQASSNDVIPGVNNATRHSSLIMASTVKGGVSTELQQRVVYNDGTAKTTTALAHFTAGDKITIQGKVVHVSGTKPAETIQVSGIKFSGSRIDCDSN